MPQVIVPREFLCPMGTMNVEVCEEDAIVRVFAEHAVHPYDWHILLIVLARLGGAYPADGPYVSADLHMWLFPLRDTSSVSLGRSKEDCVNLQSWRRRGSHTAPTHN